MMKADGWQNHATHASPPLPPMRHTLPTLPCDLADYAQSETGPLSWSAIVEERPQALVLDDPFDDLE